MTAIKQTRFSNGQRSVPVAKAAGEEMTVVVSYSFVSGEYNATIAAALTAATDRIEMFILPANHAITDMMVMGVAGSALTVDVGLLDGTAGDAVSTTREITASLYFDDASVNAAGAVRMTLAAGFIIPAVDYDRGVGIVYSGDQALGAGRFVRLVAKYAPVIL